MKVKVGNLKISEIQKLAEKYGAEDYSLKRIAGETYLILHQPNVYRNISVKPDAYKEFKNKKKGYMDKAGISKLSDSDFLFMLLAGDLQ